MTARAIIRCRFGTYEWPSLLLTSPRIKYAGAACITARMSPFVASTVAIPTRLLSVMKYCIPALI